MEVVWEMQLKVMQATHGMLPKLVFEIHQNLIHTLALHAPKCASQPPNRSALALLSLPSRSGKGSPRP